MSEDFARRRLRVVRAEVFDAHGSVIVVEGDLDVATAPQLGEVIADQIADGHRHFVVDLSAATFIESRAMGTLLGAVEPLRADTSAAVVLAGVHGIVKRTLAITGIGAMFTVFDTTPAAISSLTRRSESMVGTWRELRLRPYPTTM